jgi:nucleoside-diphosphate-sugar epimerase
MVESYRRQYGSELHQRHAHQPLRAQRQLRPEQQPRDARADPQVPHGEDHEGAHVEVWGSGSPMREFLHVDDLADACFFLLQNYDDELFVNIGTGEDLTIKALAELIKDIGGLSAGELPPAVGHRTACAKPDGTPKV